MEKLLELDRKLKQSDTIEALLEFTSLLKSNPNVREAGMLKLAEYFDRYPIHVLLALDNIPLHESFVKRVLEWTGSNDPLLRAMSLRLLGSMNVDTDELRYVLLRLLKTSHGLEFEAACFCINRIAKSNTQFAIQVCRLIYHRVHQEEIKIHPLYRVFGYVDLSNAPEVYGILDVLLNRAQECETKLSYLVAMTLFVSKTVLWIGDHIDSLMTWLDATDERRLCVIECLIYLASRHCYLFSPHHMEKLFVQLVDDQNWACKSRVAQCLGLLELSEMKTSSFALIALQVLEKGIEHHWRFCVPMAKLVTKLGRPLEQQDQIHQGIHHCISTLIDQPNTLKTKLVWILLPLVPNDIPLVLERTKHLSYPYLQKHTQLASSISWDKVLPLVNARVQLELLRCLIPHVRPCEFHFNSFAIENMYEIGLLFLSRGQRQSVDVFQTLTTMQFESKGSEQWLRILYELAQADSELSQGNENAVCRMYSALMSLRALSIVRPCQYQISYLSTQIRFVEILLEISKGHPVIEFVPVLQHLKVEFVSLRDVVQMDHKGREVVNFYLFQIHTLLQESDTGKFECLLGAKESIMSVGQEQQIQRMLGARPHPYCFFILSEPIFFELQTRPEIKTDFVMVVPKALDFIMEISMEVRLADFMKKMASIENIVVELTSDGRVLDQFSFTDSQFQGQIQVPIKPKSRFDCQLEVHVILKGNRYLVISKPVSFRK
jgi:hypothetical protein